MTRLTTPRMTTIYDFDLVDIAGHKQRLDAYRGSALLIVNVASQCALTPQYADLETLYQQHRARGFAVLGFPCNQFNRQEPGSEEEIKGFCETNYRVTFPLFAKVEVNGPAAHPLFRYLKSQRRGLFGTRSIKWNFTKFLVGRDGTILHRFGPWTTPARLEKHVVRALE